MLAQVDVNLFGAHRVIRAVLPAMRSARAGHVVNISWLPGWLGHLDWALTTPARQVSSCCRKRCIPRSRRWGST